MAIHNFNSQGVRGNSPQVAETIQVPAPFRGIDTRTILSSGDPAFCIYSYNLNSSQYGMQVRSGYREWQIDLVSASGLGVGTIIPFGGQDNDATNDRLFAVTNEGIWNCTVEAAAPILVLDFSLAGNGQNTTVSAGKGVYTPYRTDVPSDLLFYSDSENGLFQYSESLDSWVRATAITGPVIEDVVFVMRHKDQLWLFEKDKNYAWYLPDGAIGGVAQQFFLGPKFKHTSDVAGIFSWTIDGGSGIDDFLVFVSRLGDVLVYQGTSPDDPDNWSLRGQYYIGAIPKGNRFGTENGGNLYLLSIYGLTSMDEIIKGVDGKNIDADTQAVQIAAVIRRSMSLYKNNDGWDIKEIPSQGLMLISQPVELDGTYIQFSLNKTTNAWGLWRGVPIAAFDEWNGKAYFGTVDNKVMVMDVTVDNALITPTSDSNGDPIDFSVLTTFQHYGRPTQFKRVKYIRPDFLSTNQPSFSAKARYDYNLSEVLNVSTNPTNPESSWDFGLWDSALWSSGALTGFHKISGASGLGRNIAIALSGKTRTSTTLISFDVLFDAGSPL